MFKSRKKKIKQDKSQAKAKAPDSAPQETLPDSPAPITTDNLVRELIVDLVRIRQMPIKKGDFPGRAGDYSRDLAVFLLTAEVKKVVIELQELRKEIRATYKN